MSPLHLASSHNNSIITELLLRYGANLYTVNIQQSNALHIAAKNGIGAVLVLLKAGIKPTVMDMNKQTVFHYAARYNNVEAI